MAEPTQNTWVDSLAPEDKGYLATKGWDKVADAPTAVSTILKSYREAESYLGVPRDEVVRIGREPTPEQIATVYKRLGVPETADAYKFEGVPETRAAQLRELALQTKLTPSQAQAIAAGLTKAEADAATAAAASRTITTQSEDIKLRAAVGGNYDVVLAMTDRFLAQNGFSDAQKEAFTSTAQGRMLLYKFALGDSEAGLPGGGSTGGNSKLPMTPEMASEALDAKKADPAWAKRWLAGDEEAVKEFKELTQLMVARR